MKMGSTARLRVQLFATPCKTTAPPLMPHGKYFFLSWELVSLFTVNKNMFNEANV